MKKYKNVFIGPAKFLSYHLLRAEKLVGCNNKIKYYQCKGMRTPNLYLYSYIKIVDRVVFDLRPVSSYTDSFGNVTR